MSQIAMKCSGTYSGRLTILRAKQFLGSTMYLDDLYVTPSARRRGIGAKMFKAVAKAAVNRGCKRLEWTCLEWNKNAICMYEKLGGENLTKKEEWNFFRLNDSQLFHLVGQEN